MILINLKNTFDTIVHMLFDELHANSFLSHTNSGFNSQLSSSQHCQTLPNFSTGNSQGIVWVCI